jgi:hypothetical protein
MAIPPNDDATQAHDGASEVPNRPTNLETCEGPAASCAPSGGRLPLVERVVLEVVSMRGPLPVRQLEHFVRDWLERGRPDLDIRQVVADLAQRGLVATDGDGAVVEITPAGGDVASRQWEHESDDDPPPRRRRKEAKECQEPALFALTESEKRSMPRLTPGIRCAPSSPALEQASVPCTDTTSTDTRNIMLQINKNIRIETKGRRHSVQLHKTGGWQEVESSKDLEGAILACLRRQLADKTATTEETASTLRTAAKMLEGLKAMPGTAA